MNTANVENNEPDGDIHLEDVNYDVNDINDENENNFSSSESLSSLDLEEPSYSFSNMYSTLPINDNAPTYDPPASNTRRRKKAP